MADAGQQADQQADQQAVKPVRLGFVGAGMMGQKAHLANYVNLPGVELVALAEGRPALARRVADHYGVAEVVADHRALAERDDIDAVVAIMWFSLHYGVVRDLLAAGKHVLTEKALARSVPAGEALVAAAADTNRLYHVAYMKRCDPGVRRAKAEIDRLRESGEAGELLTVRVWCCNPGDWVWGMEPPLTTGEAVPNYETEEEPPQPGADAADTEWVWSWLNFYSHQGNLLRYLLGEPYEPVYVDTWSKGTMVHVRTASGARGLLDLPHWRSAWDEGFEVRFADAVIGGQLPAPLARQTNATISITRPGRSVERPDTGHTWAMGAQAATFVDAVRGDTICPSPAEDALLDVKVAWQLAQMRA